MNKNMYAIEEDGLQKGLKQNEMQCNPNIQMIILIYILN